MLRTFIDQHIVTVGGLYAYACAHFYTVLKQKENIRNSEQKSWILVGVVLNLCKERTWKRLHGDNAALLFWIYWQVRRRDLRISHLKKVVIVELITNWDWNKMLTIGFQLTAGQPSCNHFQHLYCSLKLLKIQNNSCFPTVVCALHTATIVRLSRST